MEDLQNVNSSNVLPLVSGNNKYTTTISNAIQQQYVSNHFHSILSRPIGLTKVVKKPAPRPQNWNRERPLARCAYGNSSTMYVYVKALYPMLYAGEYAKMKKMVSRAAASALVVKKRSMLIVQPT